MSATTEPTTVAAPVETKVEPTTTEGQVSTAIVEETAATDPAVIAGELTAETTQEPAKTTEEEGVVNATEAAPAKTTLTKRRTIFNPFGKSSKKDESEETKKTSKGFGSLFSRSKAETEETTVTETEPVSTELPQIEQLQPIETDIKVEGEHTVKDTINDAVEAVEAEVTEVVHEVEHAAAQVTNAIKRQSFISKFFGKKKQETTREVSDEQEETTTTPPADAAAETTEEPTTTEEVAKETTEETPARPSSPLGKLTELFTKKSAKKAKAPATEEVHKEETPAVTEETHDVEATVNETNVAEATTTTTTTPAVVTASA